MLQKGDYLKEEDIDPELKGSTPDVPDDIFDDEDASLLDNGDISSPENGTNDHTTESYDEYLNAQVLYPQGSEAKKVHSYEVEFPAIVASLRTCCPKSMTRDEEAIQC